MLLVQMKRYYISRDWTAKKCNVRIDVPTCLDLEAFRSVGGLQDHETLLPEHHPDSKDEDSVLEPDANLVRQLMAMGFSENGCKRAAIATKNPSNAELAMEWIFSHMEDPDFNLPLSTFR